MNPTEPPDNDPKPIPPTEPGAFDCCDSGCGDACVWSVYRYEQARHQAALAAWRSRHPEAP